jgi:predicted PurR-regulated permease PerM
MSKWRENKYFKTGFTIFISGSLLMIFYRIITHFSGFSSGMKTVYGILSPLVYGIFIAFLLSPVYNGVVKHTYKLAKRTTKTKKNALRWGRVLATIVSAIVLIAVIAGLVALLVPQIVESTRGIIASFPGKADDAAKFFDNLTSDMKDREMAERIHKGVKAATEWIVTWAENSFFPGVGSFLERLTNKVVVTIRNLIYLLLGMVVCFYILNSKEKLIAQLKSWIYSVCSEEKAEGVFEFGRYSSRMFERFILGKIITSLIIGVLCLISMYILKLPYPALISTIVTVTNIIPYFGPFIGAIPSAIIIFLQDPIKALIFIIMIFILQQIEGNFIEPAIVGNTTGLASFWVMFAVIVGGGLFGFPGMVLGVPIFGIIYHYVGKLIKKRLKNKGLPVDLIEYKNYSKLDIEKEDLIQIRAEEEEKKNKKTAGKRNGKAVKEKEKDSKEVEGEAEGKGKCE